MQKPSWRTGIADYDEETISVGGYRVRDLMTNLDFGGMLFVLFQQRLPSAAESRLLNAILISVVDHGIVAPSAVSRIVAASGSPIQACVAAGILTIGDINGGAGEQFARDLCQWVREARDTGATMTRKAAEIVGRARRSRVRIAGYGHPLHPKVDERVDTIVDLTRQLSLLGPHLELALEIAAEIEKLTGHPIPLNVDGAIAGALMDLGFDWRLTRTFVFVPRAAGIAAHAVEEMVRERGWRVISQPGDVEYDGPAPREYPTER